MTYNELVKQAMEVNIASIGTKSKGNLTLLRTVIPGKGVEVGSYTVDVADSTDNFFVALLIDESKRAGTPYSVLYEGKHESVVVKINTTNITFYNKFIKTIVDAV
jgi:hypothetical protein